jgi:hypothetical protein
MASKTPTDESTGSETVILSWKYPDGTVASGHPLPRNQAEQLAKVYGSMYPDQTYWLEPVRMDDTIAYARVRRRRTQLPPRNTK